MANERPKEVPFEQRSIYPGMFVKKYEIGDLEYEVEGLKDSYGSDNRMSLVVGRDGQVTLSIKAPEDSPLVIRFKKSQDTQTPNMAQRLAKIPKALFENQGKWQPDEETLSVSSLQERLRVLSGNNSGGVHINGIVGDGDEGTKMNLSVTGDSDVAILLFNNGTADQEYRDLSLTYAASYGIKFHSAVLYELSRAACEIAASRQPL